MLRITAISAGAVDYLIRGSGCSEHEHAARRVDLDAVTGAQEHPTEGGAEYLMTSAEHGEPAGVWGGTGLEMVGIEAGATATEHDVRAVFGRLEHPSSRRDDRVYLGRRPRKFRSVAERIEAAVAAEPGASAERIREVEASVRGETRKAVAYYDLTFSPVKSVSVYYAALLAQGRRAEAEKVVKAHREAVSVAMEFLEQEAAYTRTGYHGKTAEGRSVGVYERAVGLVWTRWDHSTNRNQEPQLHSHVAVLNRVRSAVTGKVQALDGKGFRPVKAGVDAIYRDELERRLEEALPVVFGLRPDGKAREILGVDPRAVAAASTRRSQVVERAKELVDAYAERHGREPSAATRKRLMQQATLETRDAKSTLTPGQQYDRWGARLGASSSQTTLDGSAAQRAEADRVGRPDHRTPLAGRSREEVYAAAVARVQRQYAVWDFGNLQDALKFERDLTPSVTGELREMTNEILRDGAAYGVVMVSAPDPAEVPAALQREDGKSHYRPHRDEKYATFEHLTVEASIVASARTVGAPVLAGPELELARVELIAAGLGADQLDAAVGVLSSGLRGDVLIGPAGAGKSRTLGGLAAVWSQHLGGRVIGVATSQIATQELAATGMDAVNTTVFIHRFTPDERGLVADRIRPGDLVVVDEAGMSSTEELATISRIVGGGGGKLLFTGDSEQLVAVGAGGMLGLLARDNGAFELTEVHRFDAEWEAAASLRLRAGDTGVLDVYAEQGRVHGGTLEEMTAAATRAWLADTLAGKESLLVVGSNAAAAELSGQIRDELVHLGRVGEEVLATDRDGNFIGVGDRIQARRNDRTLRVDGDGMVTNREVYTVLGRDPRTGEVRVRDRNGLVAHLPLDYVREDATLAYAATRHAAQGRTVDTSHGLFEPGTTRSGVYVPASRGRQANHFYVVCEREPDHHEPERLDRDPRDLLAEMLERVEDGAVSAEATRRAGEAEARSMSFVVNQWDLLTAEYGRDRYTDTLIGLLGAERVQQMSVEPGYDRLMRRVRAVELDGHDPAAVLAEAVNARGFGGVDSWTDVIRWRIGMQTPSRAPERDVHGGDWAQLTAGVEGEAGRYAQALAAVATARQAEIGQQAAEARPAWAVEHLGEPPAAGPERAEWIRRAGIAGAYRELRNIDDASVSLGAAPPREQVLHRALWQRAYAALGAPVDALDFTSASNSELREMQAAWQRATNFAPYYVRDELVEARKMVEGYRQDLVLWQAEAAHMPNGSPELVETAREIGAAAAALEVAEARVAHLAEIGAARADWAELSAELELRHRLATAELVRRGLPAGPGLEAGEQAELIGVIEPDARDHERIREDDDAQLDLDLGEGPSRDAESEEPTVYVERAPQPEAEPERFAQPDRDVEQPVEDPDQHELFALRPSSADLAAAEPLHQHTPTPAPAEEGAEPVTVGEARRQLDILAALRAEITARGGDTGAAGSPAQQWRQRHDERAEQAEQERQRRDQTERATAEQIRLQSRRDRRNEPELARGHGHGMTR